MLGSVLGILIPKSLVYSFLFFAVLFMVLAAIRGLGMYIWKAVQPKKPELRATKFPSDDQDAE